MKAQHCGAHHEQSNGVTVGMRFINLVVPFVLKSTFYTIVEL